MNPIILFQALFFLQIAYFYVLEEYVQAFIGKIKVFRAVLYIISFVGAYYIHSAELGFLIVGITVLLPRITYTIAFILYYLQRLIWVYVANKGYLGKRRKDIAEFVLDHQEPIGFATHIRNQTIDREHMEEYYENEEWK